MLFSQTFDYLSRRTPRKFRDVRGGVEEISNSNDFEKFQKYKTKEWRDDVRRKTYIAIAIASCSDLGLEKEKERKKEEDTEKKERSSKGESEGRERKGELTKQQDIDIGDVWIATSPSPFAGDSIKSWYSAPYPKPSLPSPDLESNIQYQINVNKSSSVPLFSKNSLSNLKSTYGFVDLTTCLYGSPSLPVVPLPFYSYVKLPIPDKEMPPISPIAAQENCMGKAVIGMVGGGVLGIGMGLFLGLMGDLSPAIPIINGKEAPPGPFREQMRVAYKGTLEKCMSWSKSFFILTALFSGVDCVIEKYRGKHDGYTSLISGCLVGGAMSASQGPQAACLGCVGFAAFSAVAEAVMGPH